MKKNITKSVLIITILTGNTFLLQAITPPEIRKREINQNNHQELSSKIKLNLQNKGIEKKSSQEISQKFILKNQQNNLTIEKINSISSLGIVSKSKIIDYLSKKALFKEEVKLNEYSYLIGMMNSILHRPLNKEQMKKIKLIS